VIFLPRLGRPRYRPRDQGFPRPVGARGAVYPALRADAVERESFARQQSSVIPGWPRGSSKSLRSDCSAPSRLLAILNASRPTHHTRRSRQHGGHLNVRPLATAARRHIARIQFRGNGVVTCRARRSNASFSSLFRFPRPPARDRSSRSPEIVHRLRKGLDDWTFSISDRHNSKIDRRAMRMIGSAELGPVRPT
jgi:hypothetical protein